MNGIASSASVPSAVSSEDPVGLTVLKKSQDLMAQQASALLEALPPPASPNPPGVGGHLDISA